MLGADVSASLRRKRRKKKKKKKKHLAPRTMWQRPREPPKHKIPWEESLYDRDGPSVPRWPVCPRVGCSFPNSRQVAFLGSVIRQEPVTRSIFGPGQRNSTPSFHDIFLPHKALAKRDLLFVSLLQSTKQGASISRPKGVPHRSNSFFQEAFTVPGCISLVPSKPRACIWTSSWLSGLPPGKQELFVLQRISSRAREKST